MKFTIISGSHRPDSQSLKVSRHIEKEIKFLDDSYSTHVFELANNPIPLWDQESSAKDIWQPIAESLQSSDAFVFVVPEWAGMVPPGFKNFMLMCGNSELGHKPVMLVSVSASQNGAYPIAELRMTSSKNNHAVFIPDHVIVRDVENVLNGSDATAQNDTRLRQRISYSTQMLCEYAVSLKELRSRASIDYQTYPFGM